MSEQQTTPKEDRLPIKGKREGDQNQSLATRRRLLQLGAAGLPMMLTVKAFANPAVISQLRCTLDIPENWVILVKDDGQAWMGGNISYDNQTLTDAVVASIKSESDYYFPAGTVTGDYLPTSDDCDTADDDADNKDKDKNKDDDDCEQDDSSYNSYSSLMIDGASDLNNQAWADTLAPSGPSLSMLSTFSRFDEDDDDCGQNDNCGIYKVYKTSNIVKGIYEYVNEGGEWTIPVSAEGLYLILSRHYVIENGNGMQGQLPGISCLHSVLSYLGQA